MYVLEFNDGRTHVFFYIFNPPAKIQEENDEKERDHGEKKEKREKKGERPGL